MHFDNPFFHFEYQNMWFFSNPQMFILGSVNLMPHQHHHRIGTLHYFVSNTYTIRFPSGDDLSCTCEMHYVSMFAQMLMMQYEYCGFGKVAEAVFFSIFRKGALYIFSREKKTLK